MLLALDAPIPNGSAPFRPSPVVRLTNYSKTVEHLHATVAAEWKVVTFAAPLTGGGEASVGREPGAILQTRRAVAPLLNGTANFSGVVVITYASENSRLTFSLQTPDGLSRLADPAVPPLESPPFSVAAADPESLLVLHEPAGGLRCAPFALQPRVAIKDAYNNTVAGASSELSVRASVSSGGVRLTGEDLAVVHAGVAAFGSLGVNATAPRIHLRFALEATPSPPPPPAAPPVPPALPPSAPPSTPPPGTPPGMPPPTVPPPGVPPPGAPPPSMPPPGLPSPPESGSGEGGSGEGGSGVLEGSSGESVDGANVLADAAGSGESGSGESDSGDVPSSSPPTPPTLPTSPNPPVPPASPPQLPPQLPPLPGAPTATVELQLRSILSSAVDCHGPPERIALLPIAPAAVHAVDASGQRTTSIDGAGLLAFLQMPDGSERATGSALLSRRGMWQYGHADDPLAIAALSGVEEIVFVANLSAWRPPGGADDAGGADARNGTQPPSAVGVECCTLSVPRAEAPGESIEELYVPELRIARLVAVNSGVQGGYGRGDVLAIIFATRTDRAGFGVGRVLLRSTVDELLFFSAPLGVDARAYAAAWADDCTLLLVAGNTSGAPTPRTGVFTVRLRDDFHEVRDAKRHLQLGSTAHSPPLEGTFGAASGLAGRIDPLRAAMPDLAARRHLPPAWQTIEELRIGPQPWHDVRRYDHQRERQSECDGAVGGGLPRSGLDAPTRALVADVVAALARQIPSGLPFTTPLATPHGHAMPPRLGARPLGHTTAAEAELEERTAAAVVGPNAQAQRYFLQLSGRAQRRAFGLE